MKKRVLIFTLVLCSYFTYGQTTHLGTETFSYNGNTVYHYGLGWYSDPDASAYGPMAYLSAYGGIKFFASGGVKGAMDVFGKFGIGTTTPHSYLHVNTSSAQAYNSDFGALSITPASDLNKSLSFGYDTSLGANGSGWIQSIKSGAAYTPLLLNPNNGNVGIGITTPADKLDVNGHISLSGGSREIHFRDAGNTLRHSVWITPTNVLGMGPGSESNSMFVSTAGNVSIGTLSNPSSYKLAVNGAAIATSMKVQLKANWPDFVFLKDYKLPSLKEVKTYIDKNQHLPDMPSADEVHANGLDLGEMNRLLLKKVEELTLYLIEKDKQVEQLQHTVRQESELNKLREDRMAALEATLQKISGKK